MAKKFLTGLNLVVLDTDPATGSEGELYFNSSASVAKIYQAGAWSVLGAGDVDSKSTSSVYLVRNNTGSTILKGTLVSASGAEPSGRIDVEPFAAVGGINSELTVMGMATANISNGVNGEVISFGTLTGLDTRGNVASSIAVGDETWAEGDILFAHPTVAGKLTKVRPQHDLAVAFITVRHASTGQIAVRIVPGNNHLEWMHDVSISGSVQNNEILAYNSSSSLWINQTASEAGLLTEESASSTYLTQLSASMNYLTSDDAILLYQPISVRLFNLTGLENVEGFLRTDGGLGWGIDTATYLTTESASSTYLTQTDASSVYLTQTNAENTYLTPATSASIYQPLDADLTTIAALSGSSGFLKKNIFDNWVIDSNTYLTTYDASTLYQTTGNYATISGVETLSNKTMSSAFIADVLTFDDGANSSTIDVSGDNLTVNAHQNLYLTTNTGEIVFQPNTFVKIYNEYVATQEWVNLQDYLTESSASTIYQPIGSYSLSSHNHDGTYQPADGDLSAIAAITSGVGLLKRLSSDTWTIDTASYITGSSPTISTSITSGTSTFNLINSTATTVNFAGAATTLTIGSTDAGATTSLRSPTISTTSSTLNLFNTTAATVSFAGAATSLTIGGTPTGSITATLFGNATTSTKTINIGTGGVSGSETNINIGSSTAGATGTVSVYPSTVFNGSISVPTPTTSTHAANKSYVDSLASGINIKPEVVYVSQQALNATYVNGTSDSSGGLGVDATLTGNVDGALILDGDEVQSTQRVLIRNQADQKQNGIYVVSFAGDGDDPFILTRATNFNGASATNGLIKSGDYIFVTSGSVSANDSYVVSQGGTSTNPAGAIKVGTDNIIFAQYSGVPSNISTLGYVTVGTWAATPIDKDYIDVGIARTNNPIFTGHVTIPSPVDDSDAASKEYVDDLIFASLPYLPDIVPIDDMRYEFDGINSRFLPKCAGEVVDINNPLRLLLTINGIIQVVDFPEYVWQSMLPREGFMVDSDGYIAYSEVPPVGSTFDARLMLGPNVNSIKKGYPFKAVDILLGA
jgi:hypothetical protein